MNHQRKFVKSDFGLSGNITIVLHIFFYSESKARENPRIISGRRVFTFFSIQSKNALCYHFLLRVLLLCFFVNLFLLVLLVYHQAIASGICARLNDGKIACNINTPRSGAPQSEYSSCRPISYSERNFVDITRVFICHSTEINL